MVESRLYLPTSHQKGGKRRIFPKYSQKGKEDSHGKINTATIKEIS
jgi:hypothetical protein